MKKFFALLLVVVMSLSLIACAQESTTTPPPEPTPETSSEAAPEEPVANDVQELKLNLGMDSPEDTVTYLFSKKFSDLVKEKSGGKIDIQVYSNGALGKDTELVESVQAGEVDFVVQNTAPEVSFVPGLAVFDMAKVFPDVEAARKVLAGPFLDRIGQEYSKAGLKLFGYVDQGFRQMSSNTKIESFDDFNGQKIRTLQNPYHVEYWKALGTNPTPLAWGEVYVGLQQGTITAQENPYEVIVAAKLYEQQKYVMNTNHVVHLIALVGNEAKYNGYNDATKAVITEAVQEAKDWALAEADKRVADRIAIMEENGVEIVELSDDVQQKMVEATKSSYDMIRAAIGDELVDALLNAVKEVQ